MKHVKLFEEFVKAYGEKIDSKYFKKLKKGKRVLYYGAEYIIVDNDGFVLKLEDERGKRVSVNLSMFNDKGAITEALVEEGINDKGILKAFENWSGESQLFEIGDASSKSFKWKSVNNIEKEMKGLFDDTMKLSDSRPIYIKNQFNYVFKNDDNVEYIVLFEGWMKKIRFGDPNGDPKLKYDNQVALSFNTIEDHEEGFEIETRLGDQFRIMSTLTEITNDFLVKCENVGFPIKSIFITGKGEDNEDDSMDTRRGRLYNAFIVKQIKNIKTKNKYKVTNVNHKGTDGVSLSLVE